MAYVSDDNLDTCAENDVELYAKTNSAVAAAAEAKLEEGFNYNKDAHMMQCSAGHLATRVEKRNAQNGNIYNNYCFSVKKCKSCPMRENCKIGKSKNHSYCITQVNDAHKARLEFENSEEFADKMRIRHRIEEKKRRDENSSRLPKGGFCGLSCYAITGIYNGNCGKYEENCKCNAGINSRFLF